MNEQRFKSNSKATTSLVSNRWDDDFSVNFEEFDTWLTRQLECLVDRWISFATPNSAEKRDSSFNPDLERKTVEKRKLESVKDEIYCSRQNAELLPRILQIRLASLLNLCTTLCMGAKEGKLRVETVRKSVKGKVYTSVLLRRSFRRDGKVQHETLGNLSRLPPDVIDFIKRRLNGELDADAPRSSFEIIRSLPHGNVAAVLQTAQQLGLEDLLASRPCRERDLIMALVVARILSPRSKLSTSTTLKAETAKHT